MNQWRKYLAVAALWVGVSHSAQSQEQEKPTHQAPITYSSEALNLSSTQLPQNYSGNDPVAVFSALAKQSAEQRRGEFETTEQFTTRTSTHATAPLIGTLTKASTFAFVLAAAPYYGGVDSIYHADKQTFTITARPSNVLVGESSDEHSGVTTEEAAVGLMLTFEQGEKQTFTGMNSYGAVTKVEKSKTITYSLAMDKKSPLQVGEADGHFAINVPVPRGEAPGLKPRLRCLAVVALQKPFTHIYEGHIPATVQSPYEVINITNYIRGRLLDVWVFDYATGVVIAKASRLPAKGI
jgi:hypothetical protein